MAGPDINSFVELNPGGGGEKLDTTAVTIDGQVRQRDRVVIAGDQPAELADVLNADPPGTTFGLVVRDFYSRPAEWAEIAQATNATATATRPGVTGQSHYITGIVASFDIAPAQGIRLDLREAGVNKLSLFVADPAEMELTRPYKMVPGATATLVLNAGGVGATGLVTIWGWTA